VANPRANILVVDNMPLYRDGLRVCLEDARYRVVGETGDGDEALKMLNQLGPDLVIMDTSLPRVGGFAICREMRLIRPITRVLLLTADEPNFDRQETQAILAHATGLMPKRITPAQCLQGIETVLSGRTLFQQKAVERVTALVWGEESNGLAALSSRERQVLNQITLGRKNRDIADALNISVKTVEKHISSILDKCGLPSRTAAAVLALQAGVAQPPMTEEGL
jgi:DNA-binding NarL/FixJ family response regulator